MDFGFLTVLVVCSTILALAVIFITNPKKFRNFKFDGNILGAPVKIENSSRGAPTQESLPPPKENDPKPDEKRELAGSSFVSVWEEFDSAFEAQEPWTLTSVFNKHKDSISREDREALYSRYHYLLARLGDSDGESGLIKLEAEHPDWLYPYILRMTLYDMLGNSSKAYLDVSKRYETAVAPKSAIVLMYIQKSAKFEPFDEFCKRVDAIKVAHLSDAERADCYWATAEIFLKVPRLDLFISYAEHSLAASPANHDRRFRYAYDLSELGGPTWLVQYHYEVIVKTNPKYGMAQNNLAAIHNTDDNAQAYVSLMTKAISTSKNQSIGNLAIHAAMHGFFDYAKKLVETQADPADKNFDRIREAVRIIEAEEEKTKNLIESQENAARRKYSTLREALVRPASDKRCVSTTFAGTYALGLSTHVVITKDDQPRVSFIRAVPNAPDDALSRFVGLSGALDFQGVVLIGLLSNSQGKSFLTMDLKQVGLGFVGPDKLKLVVDIESENAKSFWLARVTDQ